MTYWLKRYDISLLPKNFFTSFQAIGVYAKEEEETNKAEDGEEEEGKRRFEEDEIKNR